MNVRSAKTTGFFLLSLMLLPVLSFSPGGIPWPSGAGSVSEIGAMHIARASQSSTLLPNGKVLIAGGFAGSGGEYNPYRTTELYDPGSGTFELAATHVYRALRAYGYSLEKWKSTSGWRMDGAL